MTNQSTDLVLLVIAAKDSGTWYLGKSGTEHGLPSSALHTQAMSNQSQIYSSQLFQICAAANHWTENSFRLSDEHNLVLPCQTKILLLEIYFDLHYKQHELSLGSPYEWHMMPRIKKSTQRGESRGSLPIIVCKWLETKRVPPRKNHKKGIEA